MDGQFDGEKYCRRWVLCKIDDQSCKGHVMLCVENLECMEGVCDPVGIKCSVGAIKFGAINCWW